MTTEYSNYIFETLAKTIVKRYDFRLVIDFDNKDQMLIDLAQFTEDYKGMEDMTDCVAIWSLQRPTYDETGKWTGMDEIDYGSITQYSEVFNFLKETLEKKPGKLYRDSY